jgi:PmbA protein
MEKICRQLVEQAIQCGADHADAICIERSGVEANVFDGEVDAFVKSLSRGAGVRAIMEGRVGYAYTEKFEEIDSVAKAAVDSARISDPQPGTGIYEGQSVSGCEQALELDDTQLVTQKALELYDATMAQGADSAQACQAESSITVVHFANSAGVSCKDCQKMSAIFVEPVAKKNAYTDSNYAFAVGPAIEGLDVEDVAKRGFERAMQYYGAQSAQGGAVPVVFKADALADLLSAFAPVFSAENAQKGLSLLKGKEGTQVADERITLVDSPKHPQLPLNYAFDGEGVPTTEKNVIDKGVLTTLLYDIASSNRQGVAPTGNAHRNYSSSVVIAPYHFYFKPGDASFEELLEEAKDGIILAEVSGLHAGVNPTSGDFSLLAKGFSLKNGKKDTPIDQMVVSGSFYGLMKGVRMLGCDLTFGIPGGSSFGSPSMLIMGLTVAVN